MNGHSYTCWVGSGYHRPFGIFSLILNFLGDPGQRGSAGLERCPVLQGSWVWFQVMAHNQVVRSIPSWEVYKRQLISFSSLSPRPPPPPPPSLSKKKKSIKNNFFRVKEEVANKFYLLWSPLEVNVQNFNLFYYQHNWVGSSPTKYSLSGLS